MNLAHPFRLSPPPPLRELLLLRFELPPSGEEIELHAMAVWNVPPGAGSRSPGVGVLFHAVPNETRRRWNEFMRWVGRSHPEAMAHAVRSAPGAVDPVRRLHERVEASLEIRVRGTAVAAAPGRPRPEPPVLVRPEDPLLARPPADEDPFADVDLSTP